MWILSPLSWLLLSLGGFVLGTMLGWNRRWLLRVCGAGMAVSVAAMTPFVANRLVGWLEATPEPPAQCASQPPSVAVVLAGGVDRSARDDQDISALTIASRRRAEKAVAWWNETPGRRLVVAGGSRRWNRASEARLISSYMQRLGVPAEAIREEGESRNTWQNAHNVAALEPALPREVVLVTSAMHMRRGRYSMQEAGFTMVCPLGADWRYIPFQRFSYLVPGSSGLTKTESALHELVGLAFYRMYYAR